MAHTLEPSQGWDPRVAQRLAQRWHKVAHHWLNQAQELRYPQAHSTVGNGKRSVIQFSGDAEYNSLTR